ncbi:MAG: PilN domain-containing protein [Nitrospirae bacterium]|nr:PilN domain-containing protein [Nitrospirota bacterium]
MIKIREILAAPKQGTPLFRIWGTILRMLTFSPADDRIFPGKDISVAIQRGNVSLAYGTRVLSAIRIKEMKKYLFAEDRYPQPEELLSSLALAFSEFDLPKSAITLSIPKEWTVIRTADFPSTVKENIQKVIAYELDRLTPFSSEEAFFDFRVIEDNGDRVSLLLMAVKTDHLKPYLDVLNEGGFVVDRITVNLSAIGAVCSHRDKKSAFYFLEAGKNGYEGALFSNGLPIHNFSGVFEGSDERSKVTAISQEITALLQTSHNRSSSPQIIVLLSDNNAAFKEMLKAGLKLPVSVLGETDTGLHLSQPINEVPWAAVGSVLQSLGTRTAGINLLNKGYHEKQNVPYALTILLLLIIMTVWIGYSIAPLKIEERKLQELSGRITTKKEEARKVEELIKDADALRSEISSIQNFKNNRIMTLNIMKELTALLPKKAWTSRVKVSATSITIEGYADAATELLPKLEASPLFRKVEFASPTVRDASSKADRFNIKMEKEETPKRDTEPIANAKK